MKKKSSTKKHQQVNNDIASVQIIERKNSLHNSPYAKKGLAVSRRGSKDSCESMGTGLTIDDLIDKLLVEDPSRSDEHAATIFITFFRRFMKPGDLTRILIDRFDSDGLLEPPPTRIQERIQAIFLIWLTSYWNDFHSRRTRKLMIRFLERISKEDVLRPISASLLPLANRMAPDEDPDCHWGMADDDNEGLSEEEEEDYNNALESSDDDDDVFEECEGASMDEMSTGDDYEMTTTPTLPATKNKKDSGYSSESFVNYFPSTYDNTGKKDEDSKSISEGCIPSYSNNKKESEPALKRTASVSSFSLFGTRQRQSSITSSLGFLFSFAPMTAAKPADSDKNEEEEQQQQQQQPEKEDAKQDLPKKNKLEPSKEKQQHQQETSSPPHPTPPPKEKLKSVVTPVSQQQQQQQKQKQKRPSIDVQSITTTNTTTSINKQPPTTNVNKSNSNRTEFSGGLIDIDINCSMSASPSWTSFGATTISSSAASFISVFGAGGNNNASGFRSNNNNNNHHNDKSEKEQVNYSYKVMMEIPERAIADQLTWIESELFGKIKAREFVRNIWCPRPSSVSSEDQLNKCHSAVAASIAHFNFISAWVATIIVTQPKLNKRAGLLEKFMSIAVELRNHNNYNSLMAILAGLNSASVLRLKQTREAISDKKLFKQFKSLERLMSSDRSFSSYRLALKASEAPGIPYLGIHNQDLVSLAEGNKDLRPDGTIHWEKFRLMGECIVAMMKFQCPAYDIEPDGKILHFIADTEILSEDEQYKRSNLIEPRLKSSSTNRLRDLWLRM
ncbi:ras guanine nucleotide exchange factor domain-containing protein [Circinella umbellata]|nr:ras guanine nucleotide exchange factor domain-containing protein [Circinella umbellata]